jgi:hypothetical protein
VYTQEKLKFNIVCISRTLVGVPEGLFCVYYCSEKKECQSWEILTLFSVYTQEKLKFNIVCISRTLVGVPEGPFCVYFIQKRRRVRVGVSCMI